MPRVRTVAGAPESPRRSALPATLLALLGCLLIGGLIGRLTAPAGTESPRPPTTATPGPSRVIDGIPSGFPHSPAGAVAAALAYGALSARPDFLAPRRRAVILSRIATATFAKRFESVAGPGLAIAANGPLGRGLRNGTPTIYESAPLAYRVISFNATRAVMSGWGLALSGNTTDLPPQVDFQTAHTTLVWQGGDWKLAASSVTRGPTPALARDARPSPATSLMRLLRSMRRVRHVP
jgi:hypothetical protein